MPLERILAEVSKALMLGLLEPVMIISLLWMLFGLTSMGLSRVDGAVENTSSHLGSHGNSLKSKGGNGGRVEKRHSPLRRR